jgi:hypothetical protein
VAKVEAIDLVTGIGKMTAAPDQQAITPGIVGAAAPVAYYGLEADAVLCRDDIGRPR